MRRALLSLIPLAAVAACQSPFGPIVCTQEARASFAVTVLDAATGANLAPDATVWVREGAFVDTLRSIPGGNYTGVYERPGTYEVVAEHPGYVDWRQAGVRVEKDECHVIPRKITARLTSRP
jgi:hypothetical protein